MTQVLRFGAGSRDFGSVRGIRITPDDQVDVVELQRDPDGSTLAALREAIGCDYVDCVGLAEGFDMWIDDEGLLIGSEPNKLASVTAWPFQLAQGVPPEGLQAYVGTAVLLGVDPEDGETHTIPEAAARLLHESGMPGMTDSAVAELKEAIAKL